MGDLVAEVDLAVGCDGLVLHELQVLWCELELRRWREWTSERNNRPFSSPRSRNLLMRYNQPRLESRIDSDKDLRMRGALWPLTLLASAVRSAV